MHMSYANRFKDSINIAKEALENAIKDHMNAVDVGNKELDHQLNMQRQIVQLQSEWLLHTAKVYQALESLTQQIDSRVITNAAQPVVDSAVNTTSPTADDMLAKIQQTISATKPTPRAVPKRSVPATLTQRQLTVLDDWEFTKAQQLVFQETIYDVRSYRDMYAIFFRTMIQKYGDNVEQNLKTIKRKKPFISGDPSVFLVPIPIGKNFTEGNLSATAIRRNMAMIMEMYQLPIDSVKILVTT
jgi:hypothetical protein